MAELKGTDRYDYEVVKLLKLRNTGDTMLQEMNIMLTAMIPQFKALDFDFPIEELFERWQQKVDIDSMLYQMVPIYNRYYTREEIAGLIAFYETPLGRKNIRESPQILQETITANQTWLQVIAKDINAIANDVEPLSLKVELKKYENEIEINKLFNMMEFNFNAIASQMLETWKEASIKNAQEQNPNIPASEITSEMTSFMDKLYKNMDIEILRNYYVAIYNHHYTKEEIAGLIAFYESPLGHKSILESQIDQEFQVVAQAYGESLAKEAMEELMAEDSTYNSKKKVIMAELEVEDSTHNSKKEIMMTELKGANRYDYEVVKLLRLTDADDTMLQVLNTVLTALIPQLKAEIPDFPSEKYVERFQQKWDIESMLYQMVPIYNRYYTREEIAGLIAFNETPLGRKTISELPQIVQELIAANQTWIETTVKYIDAIANDVDSLSLKVELKKYENETEINKLFDIMGLDFNAMASQMIEAWMEDCIKNVQEQNPNTPASEITSFKDMCYKNMDIEILRNLYVAIYNRHYNQEEIAGLIAFRESPLGRKSVQVEPKITQEIQTVSQAYGESLGKEIGKEIVEELMAENS